MAEYTYETNFYLTNPVNDLKAAQAYLSDDDMSEYLRDEIEYRKDKCESVGLYPDTIISIDWFLSDEQSGKIVLKTTNTLSPLALKFISEWVSGQNSDGLGEGFEQQSFAEITDEDDPDFYDMASFDWQTNDYRFKLISVTESINLVKESADKCCETCDFYVYDYSTGESVCNCPDEFGTKWIKQESDDYWTPAYDYCDKYVEAPDDMYESAIIGLVNKILEGKSLTEVIVGAASSNVTPFKVDCPRGEYWLWTDSDGTIYGSVEKPNPSQMIVNARSVTNFTDQGFTDMSEVMDYVKKYF